VVSLNSIRKHFAIRENKGERPSVLTPVHLPCSWFLLPCKVALTNVQIPHSQEARIEFGTLTVGRRTDREHHDSNREKSPNTHCNTSENLGSNAAAL
jgi:hypothetical protein